MPERRRLIALQGTALDEDQDGTGPGGIAALPRPDEIRARVTLSPPPGASISGESDILVLHQAELVSNRLSPA
jgi:hypothetical protein